MRYLVLATDYDGTLASEGRVTERTVEALVRLRASGRRAVMVTGRLVPDLARAFPRLDLFDRVVAENGATLYRPQTHEEVALAAAPPPSFAAALRARGVPFVAGRVVVATREPHEGEVLAAIRDLGLELQIVFNKGAVMVLPAAVDKRTGLAAALAELELTLHEVVGVGDAENDHAFLDASELGAAVANALPAVRERADVVLAGARGAGVEELVGRMLADDLASAEPRRRLVPLGARAGGEVAISPARTRLLLAGGPGTGKTTAATAVLERLLDRGYQVCLVDPEGDYEGFPGLVPLGTPERAPAVEEALAVLADPRTSAALNLLGVALADRPRFLAELWPRLAELRARTGRPHWIALDEAHHLLPRAWQPAPQALPRALGSLLLVTLEPERLSPAILEAVNAFVGVGEGGRERLRAFLAASGRGEATPPGIAAGESAAWIDGLGAFALRLHPPRATHRRHRRKYAQGDLGQDAFRFRGPDGRLDLRAQNLALFLQIGEGVDDATWAFHLDRGDYARWFRDAIKDPELADDAEVVRRERLPPRESRRRIREALERRYVLGA